MHFFNYIFLVNYFEANKEKAWWEYKVNSKATKTYWSLTNSFMN